MLIRLRLLVLLAWLLVWFLMTYLRFGCFKVQLHIASLHLPKPEACLPNAANFTNKICRVIYYRANFEIQIPAEPPCFTGQVWAADLWN
jgi:hypothetical protein